jgi:hypothetical protein
MSRGNVNSGANRQASGLRMLALAAAMVGGTACTDANESLVILQAQRPDDMCVINDDVQGSIRHDRGVLDVALDKPYGYELFPLVVNNLQPIAAEGEIEPNRVSVTGAQVTIVPPPGVNVAFSEACGAEFDATGSAQMGPGETRAISLEVIRSCHSALFRDLFAAGRLNSNTAEKVDFRVIVRVKGRHGGSRILSDPFEFPIRICYGCLQTGFDGPFATFNFPAKLPACEALPTNPYRGHHCPNLIGQDIGPILCCAQNNDPSDLRCPASPTIAPATP